MKKRHYAVGETIIREGESGEEFFLISDGEVDVVRADHEVARLGRGDFFGEVALISGEPRNATVLATEPLDTFVLGKSDFQSAVETSAPFRDQLYRVYFSAPLNGPATRRRAASGEHGRSRAATFGRAPDEPHSCQPWPMRLCRGAWPRSHPPPGERKPTSRPPPRAARRGCATASCFCSSWRWPSASPRARRGADKLVAGCRPKSGVRRSRSARISAKSSTSHRRAWR